MPFTLPLGTFFLKRVGELYIFQFHVIAFFLISVAFSLSVYTLGWFALRDRLTRSDLLLISIIYFMIGIAADIFVRGLLLLESYKPPSGFGLGCLILTELPASLFLLPVDHNNHFFSGTPFGTVSFILRAANSFLFAFLIVSLSQFLRKLIQNRGTVIRALFGDQSVVKRCLDYLLGERL